MYVCRLFHRDRPFEQVEARLVSEGQISLGRDPTSDWPLGEADEAVSRTHCTLSVEDGRLILRDRSTNGTFLEGGERVPRDTAVELAPRQNIYLGAFNILVEKPPEGPADAAVATTLQLPMSRTPVPVPEDWADAATPAAPHADESLVEAFCRGAKLDASVFSGEDPAELMERVGTMYRQTVLGLAALMTERAGFKESRGLERTTIGAADNNPFKWAPTRRLAQDLLCGNSAGFLSHADAVRASFQDLSRHIAALGEGAAAAAELAVEKLSPTAIDAEARTSGGFLRGHAAVCWDIHNRRHAELLATDQRGDGALGRAFADAYARSTERPSP